MQKIRRTQILSLLLTLVLLVGLVPISAPFHVHAGYEDGDYCTYCGEYRYDDWLCDGGCGGCSENADGGDCFSDHHCPECGDCEDSGTYRCGACLRCEDHLDGICSNCELCTDCGGAMGIGFICDDCGQAACCMTAPFCDGCNRCGDCSGGDFCRQCVMCADCYEARCPVCELCNECLGDLYCPDCWLCPFDANSFCISCVRDADNGCTTVCAQCGEYCIECADDFCEDCEFCSECTDFLDCCGDCLYCAEAAGLQFCSDCDRCENCSEGFCGTCGLCSECAYFCTDCGEYCSDCADIFCDDCRKCGDNGCVDICLDCGDICMDCAHNYCDECQMCSDCVDICVNCDNYCSNCEDLCGACDYCSECATICDSCGDYCSNCNDICPECGECAEICTSICLGCFDICITCADDFCEWCQKCSDCVDICEGCGEACNECATVCDNCGLCGTCETICVGCGSHCSGCALICPIHDECEYCIDICATCETYCEYDAVICEDCGECEDCGNLYAQHYHDKYDHWYTCDCGWVYDVQSHYWSDWVIDTPATATKDGLKSRQCTECSYVEDMIIPASHTHISSDWIVDTAATETADGSRHKECTICGEVMETGSIPATGAGHTHEWSSTLKFNDTKHWYECACGYKIYNTSHTFGDWIIDTAPTATTEGSRHRECTACGYITETDIIPATGTVHTHEWSSTWSRDKTNHWHECSCGERKDITAHTPGGWISDSAATETTEGTRHKECTVCGYVTETGTIPATGAGHTHEWSNTWSHNKTNHWYECSCGEKKDVTAHTPGGWIVDIAATETTEGSRHKECTACGYITETEAIPLSHSYTNKIIEGADSIWEKGSTTDVKFVIDADFANFQGIRINGTEIDTSHYTAEEGSTVVTLKSSYLNTLEPDKYTVEFVFAQMMLDTALTVTKAASGNSTSTGDPSNPDSADQSKTPSTGDNSPILLYVLMLSSGIGIIGTSIYKRKREKLISK